MPAQAPNPFHSPLNVPAPSGGSKTSGNGALTSQTNIGNSQPPAMKTFIYSPDIRVVIAHNGVQYDVSTDIVSCSLRRAESSAASFFMTLSNKDLRYTGGKDNAAGPKFSRMDRIVVYMKRVKMVQVFSGYLDTVPYRQLYPGTVNFKATCTIKRLMHTWWNPATDRAQQLLSSQMDIAGANPSKDSGIGALLRDVLTLVGGWKDENIHIQNFPTGFIDLITQQGLKSLATNQAAADKFRRMLLGAAAGSAAPGSSAGANPNAGVPGPQGPPAIGVAGGNTAFYVSEIMAACDARGMGPLASDNNLSAGLASAAQTGEAGSPGMTGENVSNQKAWAAVNQVNLAAQQANRSSDAAILGVACAAVETGGGVAIRNLYNVAAPGSQECTPNDGPGTDHTSCGIFQQQDFPAWGTVQQRMNPRQAANMFFGALATQCPDWRNLQASGQGGAAIQTVQQCDATLAYKYQLAIPWATAQVQALRTASSSTAAAAPVSSLAGSAPSTAASLATGAASTSPGTAALPARPGKPVPDSEGAINWGMTQIGQMWNYSQFINLAFKAIGVDLPTTTQGIAGALPTVPAATIQRGDLCAPFGSDYMCIWLGDGQVLEGSNSVGGGNLSLSGVQAQQYSWDCGPTATQIVLAGQGVSQTQNQLIADMGTNDGGTPFGAGVISGTLNNLLPGANYREVSGNVSSAQMFSDISTSIADGRGVVMNWNTNGGVFPNGVKGTHAASYSGSIQHYVAVMAADPSTNTLLIADPANGSTYWITADNANALSANRGYVVSNTPASGTGTSVSPAGNSTSGSTSSSASNAAQTLDGQPIHGVRTITSPVLPSSMSAIYRAPGVLNGGPDPTAPFSNPIVSGPGQAPGSLSSQGAGGAGVSSEGIAMNLFSYIFTQQFEGETATDWPGEKTFLDGCPLIQTVSAICSASLRQFCSGPNGDFLAYYPDYWGLDGKPAVLTLQDIELKDVRIDFSDDPLTTHVYVDGDVSQLGQIDQVQGWLESAGVATVEDDWLFARLKLVVPGDLENSSTGDQIMRKYGIRPLKQTYAMAGSHELELLLACQVFLEKWAQQYQTTVSMTFMPELFPGMRVALAGHNLTVYVTEVVHQCDFENGFTTTATIMAPANMTALEQIASINTGNSTPTDTLTAGGISAAFTDPVAGLNSYVAAAAVTP